MIPAMQQIEENLGAVPRQLLADTAFATGQNLSDLQSRRSSPSCRSNLPGSTRRTQPCGRM